MCLLPRTQDVVPLRALACLNSSSLSNIKQGRRTLWREEILFHELLSEFPVPVLARAAGEEGRLTEAGTE